jgi:hypothetical protein
MNDIKKRETKLFLVFLIKVKISKVIVLLLSLRLLTLITCIVKMYYLL